MTAAPDGPEDRPDLHELPFDPERPPWGGGAETLRADYRARMAELDAELVAAGRGVVEMLAPVADLDGPMPFDAVERGAEQLAAVRARTVRIEDAAFTVTALESPVGRDLREVVAVIRALYDVVRSGRLALHVIEHLDTLERCGLDTRREEIGRMRVLAVEVLADAVRGWEQRDALAHNDLEQRDQEIDRLRSDLQGRTPTCGDAACVVAHVLLVRFLERLGDHGVDVCSHLSWAVTGDRVLAEYGLGRADT